MKTAKWKSPSNIALIKYWGKYSNQLPSNPSISFTLDQCATTTQLSVKEKLWGGDFSFDVLLDGKEVDSFRPKIQTYLEKISGIVPWIKGHHLTIETSNSFPHSSGIASSASGMSALSLCLLQIHEEMGHELNDFYRRASVLSRIGSGSASRSVYGGLVVWGSHKEVKNSHQEYAVPFSGEVDDVFMTYKDIVLLVDVGEKKVSSTVGHGLMKGHPYAEARFASANQNLSNLIPILKDGELEDFGKMVESEALTLHAMMMASNPYFILMKPNTLKIIEAIWEFRRETKIPAYFTLDAGANVHLLYPEKHEQSVMNLVNEVLVGYCKDSAYICDKVGNGPTKL